MFFMIQLSFGIIEGIAVGDFTENCISIIITRDEGKHGISWIALYLRI